MRIRTRKQELHTKGQYLWSSDVRGKWKLFTTALPRSPDICLDGFQGETITLSGFKEVEPDKVFEGYRVKEIVLTGDRSEK